jgi:tetratricopeptide (TPR) repeat protein
MSERAQRAQTEIVEKLLDSEPNQPSLWHYLANMYVWLGDTQWRLDGPEDGDGAFRRAMEIYREHAAEFAAEIKETPKEALRIIGDYLRLAYYLATTHREEEAAELVRQAALHAKRITEPVDLIANLGGVALLQLRLGDLAGYRENCQALADVPVDSADDLTKVRSINVSCFGPASLEDMSFLVKRAEQVVTNNSFGQRHVGLHVLGAALYRDGQYQRAAERLEESIGVYPENPAPHHDVINFQRLWLAMTKWQLGQQDEARQLLAETQPAIDKELISPSCFWFYRLGLEVLRSEAQTLIRPNDADEAVENTRTSDEPTQ